MNILNFIQTGGWPLKLERLKEMQDAWLTLQSFGSLAGNLTIIKGCELVGGTVKAGFIYVDGELLEFRESYLVPDATVVIIEEENLKEFENGEIKNVYTERYATFGDGDNGILWSEFKKPIQTKDIPVDIVDRLLRVERAVAPMLTGHAPMLWCRPAAEIPDGWVVDYDWKGRMPIGFDADQFEFNVVGKIGGAKNKTLSIAEMPPHKHKLQLSASDSGNTERRVQGGSLDTPGWTNIDVEEVGGGQQFSILNPHKVVYFIKMLVP